jgi:hypothetical protein
MVDSFASGSAIRDEVAPAFVAGANESSWVPGNARRFELT